MCHINTLYVYSTQATDFIYYTPIKNGTLALLFTQTTQYHPKNFIFVLLTVIQWHIIMSNQKKGGKQIMATKSANVLARVEPEVKEQAESIMSKLGLPASVVINALYKQIIMTKSIPFSLSLPKEPSTLDSMTTEEFNSIMETGLSQARSDQSRPVADVFSDLRREIQ